METQEGGERKDTQTNREKQIHESNKSEKARQTVCDRQTVRKRERESARDTDIDRHRHRQTQREREC